MVSPSLTDRSVQEESTQSPQSLDGDEALVQPRGDTRRAWRALRGELDVALPRPEPELQVTQHDDELGCRALHAASVRWIGAWGRRGGEEELGAERGVLGARVHRQLAGEDAD